MKQQKQNKKDEVDYWTKICLLPLIIGFALVVAGITNFIFKVIGWVLLIFGLLTGSIYLFKIYKTHKEKILEFLRRLYLIKRKEENK